MLFSFSEYLWCSSIAFFVVGKLLFSKGRCNCLNVVYLRIFVLFSGCCFCTVNFQVRHLHCVFSNFIYILFSEFCYYSLSADFILCMFMLAFQCCYSTFVYVVLRDYELFTECLFYSPNVVILGILLFLERLCYSLNVCVVATCCCYTVNVFILCILAFFSEWLYFSLNVDILRVLLLFSECQHSVNIYVVLRNLYYYLNVFVALNAWFVILPSVESLYYFKKWLLCLTHVSINVSSRQEWML